jgi:hypothetical protein
MITERTEVSAQAVRAPDAPSRAGVPPWLIWGGMIGLVQIFAIATVQPLGVFTAYPQLYQSPSQSSQKQQLMTPSIRFPLHAGGTEQARLSRFPSRSGGNLKEGGNS